MQYILTEEEYENLISGNAYHEEREKVRKLNRQVLKLSGFDCIYERPRLMVYCDNCPIVETCPINKSFSQK